MKKSIQFSEKVLLSGSFIRRAFTRRGFRPEGILSMGLLSAGFLSAGLLSASRFIQLEAQFIIACVSQDDTKFYTVICAIEPDILSSVSDIVSHPSAMDKYKALKT